MAKELELRGHDSVPLGVMMESASAGDLNITQFIYNTHVRQFHGILTEEYMMPFLKEAF